MSAPDASHAHVLCTMLLLNAAAAVNAAAAGSLFHHGWP
jgi:hypothetical protein